MSSDFGSKDLDLSLTGTRNNQYKLSEHKDKVHALLYTGFFFIMLAVWLVHRGYPYVVFKYTENILCALSPLYNLIFIAVS